MSFILLGILNAQAAGAAAGSYDLLETEILTGTQASVTFSSLNSTYGADYQHLQLRMVAVGSGQPSYGVWSQIRFNGDTDGTSPRYAWHELRGNGSTVSSSAGSNYREILTFTLNDGKVTAAVTDILNFASTSTNKTLRTLTGNADLSIRLGSGLYNTLTAIDEITVSTQSNNYAIGSRFSLYGLKASE